MKVFDGILTSLTSGTWVYSNALATRYAEEWRFNLDYYVDPTGSYSLDLAWTGCSIENGVWNPPAATHIYSNPWSGSTQLIVSSVSTDSYYQGGQDGRGSETFTPGYYPFIKIAAFLTANGTTPDISCTVVMD